MIELIAGAALSDRDRHFLTLAKQSSDNLINLVNEILDFSKIEAGGVELARVTFDIRDLIETAFGPFAVIGGERGIEVIWSVNELVPKLVVGDPTRVQQVLTNLISNALKFTSHGRIALSVGPAETNAELVLLRFELSDTGISVFPLISTGRFLRSSHRRTCRISRSFAGAGLGLSISKELCRLMGGEIGVISDGRTGSTFWFTIRLVLPTTPVDFERLVTKPVHRERESRAAHGPMKAPRILWLTTTPPI